MARERHRVLHRINFESPYVEMPKRLTVRQNLKVFGALYNVADIAGRIDKLAAELDLTRLARPARPASSRPGRRRASRWRRR